MKSALFYFLLAFQFFSHFAISQAGLEKGYFVDNQGEKIECLIRDKGWKDNPVEFQYKIAEDSELIKATIEDAKEFSVYGKFKYIRSTVKIDKSQTRIDRLNHQKNPEFVSEALFLKVIVEGKATLFEYQQEQFAKYFFKTDSIREITQLLFKEFINQEGNISQNNAYKQQLWNNLRCEDIQFEKLSNIRYSRSDLERVFTSYNNCVEPGNNQNYTVKIKLKDALRIKVRGGYVMSSLVLSYPYSLNQYEIEYNGINSFSFGGEIEYILPFNKNKWGLMISSNFQSIEKTDSGDFPINYFEMNYKSIEIPVGLRYYSFLNKKISLYIDIAYVADIVIEGEAILERNYHVHDFRIQSVGSFQSSFGVSYNNLIGIDLRYGFGRELFKNWLSWGLKYVPLSINLSIKVF